MLLSTLIFLRQVIKMSCCATRFRFFRPFVCRHCRGFSGHSQLAKVGRFSACCWEGWYSKCEMGWNWMIRWSKRNNRWVAQRLIGRSGARWRSLGWGWGGVKRGIGSFIFTWRESWKTAKNGGIVQSAKTNHKKNWLSFLYTLRQWPMASFWGFFFTKGEFAIFKPALLGNGCLCNVFVFLVVFLLRKHSPSSSCMALLGEGACATEWR